MKHIFLDSHPLSQVCNPHNTAETVGVRNWTKALIAVGHQVYIPEVIDFEVRRELIRAGKTRSIVLLAGLRAAGFIYLSLDTATMLRAADLWAWARNQGMATAGPLKLDIDVILAAQVREFVEANSLSETDTVIATSNAAHLSRFGAALEWTQITA